jgi:hypothetical protein
MLGIGNTKLVGDRSLLMPIEGTSEKENKQNKIWTQKWMETMIVFQIIM